MARTDPQRPLAGRVIAITGAGRGIGRSYALAMAAAGGRIVVNDLGTDLEGRGQSAETATAVTQEIQALGGEAVASGADVSDEKGAASIVEAALDAFGRLDAVVNNAAIEFRGSLEEHTAAIFDRVLAVNVRGSFNCARAAIPAMRSQGGGMILNTTSGAFWEGAESVAAYSASKAAVFSLTLSQHSELSGQGISANCIAPNATRTRMLDAWLAQIARDGDRSEEDVLREYGIQDADNLAPLATYLCSPAARGISGQIFEVHGDRIVRVSRPTRSESISRESDEWTFETLDVRLPEIIR